METRPPPHKLAYTPAEAGSAIGVSRSKVFELISVGELVPVKIGGCTLIEHDQLTALLARHRILRPA